MNGIINVYKEKGFTSHDVVAKLRGILKQKKIGHTGTLDPEAEGVLPICLGKATKVCDLLTEKDKVYETVMKLGIVTDTQDMTGVVLEQMDYSKGKAFQTSEGVLLDSEERKQVIREICMSFLGTYSQVPPMYSALKVNGKKLYELAREGKVVERKARQVTIHDLVIKNIDLEQAEIAMEVTCSKGTYIRTLCHDIGEKLGCGACMKELKRTRVERFLEKDSLKLEKIEQLTKEGKIEEYLLSIDDIFLNIPKVIIKEVSSKLVYNGNPFYLKHIETERSDEGANLVGTVRVYDIRNIFIGLYEYEEDKKRYKPVKLFL